MTEQAAHLAASAFALAMVLPFAIPPMCRYRTLMRYRGGGGQVLLSLTRRGALRTAYWARREGYVGVRVYRV